MNTERLSIRTLIDRMNNPPKPKLQCCYLIHKCQLIRGFSGDKEESYTDSHYECNKMKKRIDKKYCLNCKLYKPI